MSDMNAIHETKASVLFGLKPAQPDMQCGSAVLQDLEGCTIDLLYSDVSF